MSLGTHITWLSSLVGWLDEDSGMYDCIKSFYSQLLSRFGVLGKDFDVREVYVDESLYMVDRSGVNINPLRLYKLLASAASVGVRRRPVFGILYRDKRIGRVIRLLSNKHNVFSVDLSVLRRRERLSVDYLGRLSDVVQLSKDLYSDIEFRDDVSVEKVGWLGGLEVVYGGGLLMVVTKDELLTSLLGYMYASRFIVGLLGEWILFNPIVNLGEVSTRDIKVIPVDEKGNEVVDNYDEVVGFLVECGGRRYIEYL